MILESINGNNHAIYIHWVRLLKEASQSVHIVVKDRVPLDWVFCLAPSLLCALDRGVRINVLYYTEKEFSNDINSEFFHHRIHYLASIGCTVRVRQRTHAVPLTGIGKDLKLPGLAELVHHYDIAGGAGSVGTRLKGAAFLWLFEFFRCQIADVDFVYSPPSEFRLNFRPADLGRATHFLANHMSPYYANRKFEERYVQFEMVDGQKHPLRQWKLDQIKVLEGLYQKYKITPFSPMIFNLTNGNDEIFQGIIVEPYATGVDTNGYFIAEGHTRAVHLQMQNDRPDFLALVMKGKGIGPPSETISLYEMKVDDSLTSTKQNPQARFVERSSREGKRWAVSFKSD